jgi:transaldolase
MLWRTTAITDPISLYGQSQKFKADVMTQALQSLVQSGTKLYLDSVHPAEVDKNLAWGAVGATSNPAIISSIVAQGEMDEVIESLLQEPCQSFDDAAIAWELTDRLVGGAQEKFKAIHASTHGEAGWVSFELEPLLEDPLGIAGDGKPLTDAQRAAQYIELGKRWAAGHTNRMIKVPATQAGILALEELAAAGVTLNVTLIFTADQYRQARNAVWRGAQRLPHKEAFKSVYSIFVSRIDVYTQQHLPNLSPQAQGMVGILNAKRIWAENSAFWQDKGLNLQQELIFASTGVKDPSLPAWKYVEALAGSDIQTNPPETNEAIAGSDITFFRQVDQMPSQEIQDEIDAAVNIDHMQRTLMAEGIVKFVKPQRALLDVVRKQRQTVAAS